MRHLSLLHRVITDLPPDKQAMLERLHGSAKFLRGRKILVVDDDARNIFALTSLLGNAGNGGYQRYQRGKRAIEIIQSNPDLSVVLGGHHDA